jgi:hypothetical protein
VKEGNVRYCMAKGPDSSVVATVRRCSSCDEGDDGD